MIRHADAEFTSPDLSELNAYFAAPELCGACDKCGRLELCRCHDDGDTWENKETMQTDVYAFGCLYYAVSLSMNVSTVHIW